MNVRHSIALALAVAAAACAEAARSPTDARAPRGPAANLTGAVFTTDSTCGSVDQNLYAGKDQVYVNGGPNNDHAAGLPDGAYYVRVTAPDGTPLGSSVGTANARPAVVSGGRFAECYQLAAVVKKASDGTPGYDDTPNEGGEYKLWISADPDFAESESKTDNFKVLPQVTPPPLPEVSVAKTASTTFDRYFTWGIAETADATGATLAPGQSKTVTYAVTATKSEARYRDFAVAGTITVTNVNGVPATVAGVSDVADAFGGIAVSCDHPLPYTLQNQGDVLTCTYAQPLSSPAFGTAYTNTATASVTNPRGGPDILATGTAGFSFDPASPTRTIDDCVNVSESYAGPAIARSVCATTAFPTFTRTFGPGHLGDCGTTQSFADVATLQGTEASARAGWTVAIQYVCGCTPGYWKNNTGGWPTASYQTTTLEQSPFPAAGVAPYVLSGKYLGQSTLLQGLGLQGNSTTEGGAEILLRAATAALLNASRFGYAISAQSVRAQVNAALATNDRAQLVALAAQLDTWNNAGCPLNAKGQPVNP